MTTAHASHNTDAREEMHLHARQFLRQWHDESGTPGFTARWRHLSAEIAATGTWQPTSDELTYGARVAWRNAGRCLGRARWSSLIVRDRRHTTTLPTLLQELTAHLDEATNNGRVRSVLTVLAPATAIAAAPLRIISPQLARYAAWHTDGGVIGDPANLTLTALARRLGWDGPPHRGAFDLLPWIVATADRRLHLLHPDHRRIRQVPIHHPRHPWLADLALRWPAVPAISNMSLHLGGLRFPAPFNGTSMVGEIARDLADHDRYHQLPAVIDGLGLPDHDQLRADRALLTLHAAVLHSFNTAGLSITDHHRESCAFARFAAREQAARPATAVAGNAPSARFVAPVKVVSDAGHRLTASIRLRA
ncbi:nitric oxide synthase oxygenase [Micromonospora sp. HUAS LYJ1]|uniref:nitric oxide synthase oxygenase n=1 Tax=Micromonospora sp. HUAS LYJ1 TaxID=3061626 RepID=UPI002671A9DB|nr:nitric oxide synthase oxygenase [Micromonospora sp. HUAS LYJ1]WKU03492.1 nitric oxide synthase oxygenase [Micromonospora sp. HUAS LYJ1]